MTYEVTQFSTYQFASNEALGFHNHILAETSVLPEATTGKVLSEYRAAVEELKVMLKNTQGDVSLDELVKAADKRRDDAYFNGLAYLTVMTKSVSEEVSAAATAIKAVFDKFPDIRKANNNTETGVLENLLEDLGAIDKATMKLAAFTPWFQELEGAQKAFVDAVHNKIASNPVKTGNDLKTAKANCENAYKALIKRVNAVAELESDNDKFDPTFINNVNAFIESLKVNTKTKSTKKSDGSDADESSDPESVAEAPADGGASESAASSAENASGNVAAGTAVGVAGAAETASA